MHSSCKISVLLFLTFFLLAGCLHAEAAQPWGGVVSHHLLVGKYIDEFFACVKKERDVETFIIICPSHFGLSVQPWSVADCSWKVGEDAYVHTDFDKSQKVLTSLNVPYDPQVFPIEHGASALMPFIYKYYPKATVVVVAVQGEPPHNSLYNRALSNAVLPFLGEGGNEKNFLLISSDFSHHGNMEKTKKRDDLSEIFLSEVAPEKWVYCSCDNRPGMYLLAQMMTDKTTSKILCHTNSYAFSGEGKDDITSYFFVLFYD